MWPVISLLCLQGWSSISDDKSLVKKLAVNAGQLTGDESSAALKTLLSSPAQARGFSGTAKANAETGPQLGTWHSKNLQLANTWRFFF
jgi:hypothetical protein